MRWTQTLSKVHTSWDGRTQTLLKASAGHEMNTFVKCVCKSWDGWTQSTVIRNSTVMRWINTNTVKCVSHEVDGHIVKRAGHEMDRHKHCQMSAGHEMDGQKQTSEPPPPQNRHQSPPPPPPPPPPHVVTRALHILITPTEQTSYPETWTKLQLMHQRILLAKEYMNQRLITTEDQQNWVKNDGKHCLMTNVNRKKYYHIPVFCKKCCSIGSTWKRSVEEVTYNSPDVK